MADKNVMFLIFTVIFSEVATWTVDLPEVRKYFFEQPENKKSNPISSYAYNDERMFDNIKGDSPHNSPTENHLYDFLKNHSNDDENDVFNGGKYANDFGYQPYKQKEVQKLVRDGSAYLQGLQQAIEQFAERLKMCQDRLNKTQPTPPPTGNPRWLPENERPLPESLRSEDEQCSEVTRAGEHVRRLSELALWATKELQDRAYNNRYNKHDGPEAQLEETELLLRLAWFLERLAQLTGFRTQQSYDIQPSTTTTTTTPAPVTVAPSSQEIVQYLLQCMRKDDSRPAPDRCRYPLTLPDDVKRIFNTTDAPTSASEQEDIVYLTALQSKDNEDVLTPEETKHSIHKRSTSDIDDNPSVYFVKYYIKHKVWENDNPITKPERNGEMFEVQNHLTDVSTEKRLEKRSIDKKKSIYFRIPENPMQDISQYVKHKSGIRIVKDSSQAKKFRKFLDKIRNSNRLVAKKNALKLEKILHRPKRSLQYSKFETRGSFHRQSPKRFLEKRSAYHSKKYQPRIPENPYQDISYYVKNKRGTNYNANAAQASAFRLGLEQIYQTGNIEVVRRYGSNYNPAVPAPFFAALAAGFADQ